MIIDTGCTVSGYWCDFDRNFVVGGPDRLNPETAQAHDQLWLATQAGFDAARPGCTAQDLYRIMADFLPNATFSTGRLGHGLGLELTEHFSIAPHDQTVLEAGFVITLEPGMPVPGGQNLLVHEENVLITPLGAEWLSRRAPRRMTGIMLGKTN